MIKANELRVGNWVKFEYDTFFYGRVTAISERGAEILDTHKHVAPNCIFPIPLTIDILEKACGFEKNTRCWFRRFKREKDELLSYFFVGRLEKDPPGMWYYGFESPMSSVNINNIYYLHQLQNLYFALTGEELNIQL